MTYQVYVRSFADSDGDGIGDLPGITSRLPYLRDLGVDALWITPFYTSPQHDHGYDVADYRDVDPLFGTLADADALVARAHELGLRVIVDLVPNHTSSEHAVVPRRAGVARPASPERARYLFRDGRGPTATEPPNNWGSVFGGPAWTRVPDGQWYLHLFDTSQPDLDWRNPEVGDEFESVLRFWLDRGVDGFRVDVAHGLVKEESLRDQVLPKGEEPSSSETHRRAHREHGMVERTCDEPMWDQPEVHDVYRRWHRVLAEYPGDRMTVAEAWTQTPESMAALRPRGRDEPGVQLRLAAGAVVGARVRARSSRSSIEALDDVDAAPTWVLSNHDVDRHVDAVRRRPGRPGPRPRRDAGDAGAARLGVPLPGRGARPRAGRRRAERHRQDPAWLRTGEVGRDGCRVPIPWAGDAPPYGFGPGTGQPWIPQPHGLEATDGRGPGAATPTRRWASTGPRWPPGASTRVTLDRGRRDPRRRRRRAGVRHAGPLTVVLNAGAGRRRAAARRRAGRQR